MVGVRWVRWVTLIDEASHTCTSFRETSSKACGRLEASIFSLAAASSTKSIALSGRNRSGM